MQKVQSDQATVELLILKKSHTCTMVPKVNSVAAAKLASAPLFSLKIHSRQPTHATGCGPRFLFRYRT